jgi:hypothetical protein
MAVTSQALQRVLAHKRALNPPSKQLTSTMEGIYLTKLQLKTLGENLLNMANGPDGLCFMIGAEKIGGKTVRTVEIVPYLKNDPGENPNSRTIFNDCIFRLNAGGMEQNSTRDLIIDSNGHHKENKQPAGAVVAMNAGAITTGSQKTPPPFS